MAGEQLVAAAEDAEQAMLADALNEPASVTIDGERRKIIKREAVVHQLVNKSATADLRATKMLFDMIKDVGSKSNVRQGKSLPKPSSGNLRWGPAPEEPRDIPGCFRCLAGVPRESSHPCAG